MQDIISTEENVISISCENHCYKDINEGNINTYIIYSIIYLKIETMFLNISVIST